MEQDAGARMTIYASPYMSDSLATRPKKATVYPVVYRKILGTSRRVIIHYNKQIISYSCIAGTFDTLKIAKRLTDQWMIDSGYVFLTKKQFDNYEALI
jgi:hypothetical protein